MLCYIKSVVGAASVASLLGGLIRSDIIESFGNADQAEQTSLTIWWDLFILTAMWFVFAAIAVLAGLDALYLVYASLQDLTARAEWAGDESQFSQSIRDAFEDAPVRELASVTAQFQRVLPCDVEDQGQRVSLVALDPEKGSGQRVSLGALDPEKGSGQHSPV